MRKKLTDAQWERFQTQNREQQIEIIKTHLSRVFARRFADQPDASFEHGRAHAENCFIANRMAKYIRSEDNSVRGFHRRYQCFDSPAHREEYTGARLAEMFALPPPLPPQFMKLTNYTGGKRFVAINYQGTKAVIDDGTMSNTFSFYQAYSPLINHPAIFAHLRQQKAHLGADDAEATHSLILDTGQNKIYLATRRRASEFLEMQLPQTPEERRAADDKLQKQSEDFEKSKSLAELQNSGMFEFIAPADNRSLEVEAMGRFLDEYVPQRIPGQFQSERCLHRPAEV